MNKRIRITVKILCFFTVSVGLVGTAHGMLQQPKVIKNDGTGCCGIVRKLQDDYQIPMMVLDGYQPVAKTFVEDQMFLLVDMIDGGGCDDWYHQGRFRAVQVLLQKYFDAHAPVDSEAFFLAFSLWSYARRQNVG